MRVLIAFLLLASTVFGSTHTIGPDGIDSAATGLDGSRNDLSPIEIGMAELWRAGKAGYDGDGLSASNTTPYGVYRLGVSGMAEEDQFVVDEHATLGAGVMIADDSIAGLEGVAPGARLHSISVPDPFDPVSFALSLNRLATLNDENLTAINIGQLIPIGPIENPGRNHLTLYVDWSARQHEVLYVVIYGNDDFDPSWRVPADNYNGITVASSTNQFSTNNVYDSYGQFNFDSDDFFNTRSWIDVIAPGESVAIAGHDDTSMQRNGTSWAAPHVTGTVALLYEYAERQTIDHLNERFFGGLDHRIVKAVIMNSADKLSGVHGSTRDIHDSQDLTWNSTLYGTGIEPLHPELGTGQVNAGRAVQQLSSGRYEPNFGTGDFVPSIGWGESNISPGGQEPFPFADVLEAGEHIAITLVWDRVVNSTGGSSYNFGDELFTQGDLIGLDDLDLFLYRAESPDQPVAHSISQDHNEEHIFFEIQTAGHYFIVVDYFNGQSQNVNYALAWWYGDAPATTPGDFDNNGSVGPEDYDLWKTDFGSTTTLAADGNGNGVVDAADYTVWRDNLSAGAGSSAAVPEPSGLMMLAVAALLITRYPRNLFPYREARSMVSR